MTTEELLVKIKADTSELDRKLNNVKSNLEMNVDTKSAIKELNSIEKKLGEVFGKSKKNSIFGVLDSSLSDTEKKIKTLQSSIQSGLSKIYGIEDDARGQVYNMQGADLAGIYGDEKFFEVTDQYGKQLKLTQEQYNSWSQINEELTAQNDELEKQKSNLEYIKSQREQIQQLGNLYNTAINLEGTAEGEAALDKLAEAAEQCGVKFKILFTALENGTYSKLGNLKIQKLTQELSEGTKKYKELKKEISEKESSYKNNKGTLLDTSSGLSRLTRYLSVGTIIFRSVTAIFRDVSQRISEGMENAYEYSKLMGGEFSNVKDEIESSSQYLTNAIGSAAGQLESQFMPLITAVFDNMAELFNWFTEQIALVQSIVNKDTEIEFTQAVKSSKEFKENTKSTEESVKKINQLISGFDELNIFSSSSSSNSAKSALAEYEKDFQTFYAMNGVLYEKNTIDTIGEDLSYSTRELSYYINEWVRLKNLQSEVLLSEFDQVKLDEIEKRLTESYGDIFTVLKDAFANGFDDLNSYIKQVTNQFATDEYSKLYSEAISSSTTQLVDLESDFYAKHGVSWEDWKKNNKYNIYAKNSLQDTTGFLMSANDLIYKNEVFPIQQLYNKINGISSANEVISDGITETENFFKTIISGGSTLQDVVDAIKAEKVIQIKDLNNTGKTATAIEKQYRYTGSGGGHYTY